MTSVEVHTPSTNLIGNSQEIENDQSEVLEPTAQTKESREPTQMMSRKRAKALAKQLAAAGIEEAK